MLVATVEVSAWGHADDPRGDTPDGALASFGTSDGHLYGSTDEGATWNELASGLPPIHRVLVLSLTGDVLQGSLDRREVRVGVDLILRAHRGLRDRDDGPTVSTRPAGQPEDPRPVLEYPRCHQGLRATLRAGAVLVHSRSIGRHAVIC